MSEAMKNELSISSDVPRRCVIECCCKRNHFKAHIRITHTHFLTSRRALRVCSFGCRIFG
jgi:hypothetical protein